MAIEVLGARVHNLKNIDVTIPGHSLSVVTGLSGSGKSSLAFDTIYAEGQRRYIETFSSYARNFLGNLEAAEITSKDVFDAAQAGDALAKEIFDFTGRIMGQAFADFVSFSAPEAIILFGGLANAGDLLMKPIVKAMEENLLQIWKGKIKVLPSGLAGADAAVLGASALGWKAQAVE